MNFLAADRAVLERLLPGFDRELAALPFGATERPGNPAIPLFRARGGPGLLVPAAAGGPGAPLADLVRIQRAIGSRSPSLAVATTMHHFSVASIAVAAAARPEPGIETALLSAIASENLYVSSGFAEGRSGAGILSSALRVEATEGGWLVSGSKKPCCLSASMGILTASLAIPGPGGSEIAVAAIPAGSPGLSRRPFWSGGALGGAESDEVVLDGVFVPEEAVAPLEGEVQARALFELGMASFGTLLAASYAGIASGLVERAIRASRGRPAARERLAIDLDRATDDLVAAAVRIESGEVRDVVGLRSRVHETVASVARSSFELLGGIAFATDAEVAERFVASHAMVFHPPGHGDPSAS